MLKRRGQGVKKSFLGKPVLMTEMQTLFTFPPTFDRFPLIYRGHGPLSVTSTSISRESGLRRGGGEV